MAKKKKFQDRVQPGSRNDRRTEEKRAIQAKRAELKEQIGRRNQLLDDYINSLPDDTQTALRERLKTYEGLFEDIYTHDFGYIAKTGTSGDISAESLSLSRKLSTELVRETGLPENDVDGCINAIKFIAVSQYFLRILDSPHLHHKKKALALIRIDTSNLRASHEINQQAAEKAYDAALADIPPQWQGTLTGAFEAAIMKSVRALTDPAPFRIRMAVQAACQEAATELVGKYKNQIDPRLIYALRDATIERKQGVISGAVLDVFQEPPPERGR